MNRITTTMKRRTHKSVALPSYVHHPDFEKSNAYREFDATDLLAHPVDYSDHYMPDDVTKNHTARMHYCAYRMHHARTAADLHRWQGIYFQLRDQIVLGNRKLIYRAVRRRMATSNRTDDLIGDCHIVLIQAVAVFNPWLGIRFSTYAYTCLIRALSRLSQRQATDWLTRSVSLEALPDGEPGGTDSPTSSESSGQVTLDEFLRDDHPLLSPREKVILMRRFNLGDGKDDETLEMVGKAIGLSKERVRQVQAMAIDKLRAVLNVSM